MKNLQYLFTILYFQNSLCTIDVSIPEYQYLSRRLTLEECKRLYASLHSTTFNLSITTYKNVPDVPCLKLLTKWDTGGSKYEGKTKSHVDVVRRLRQIGRDDLAEWLSDVVFKKLVKDVNADLDAKFSNDTVAQNKSRNYERVKEDWTLHDTVMWSIFAGLVTTTVMIIGRVIAICCKKRVLRKKAKEEEIMELLNYGSLDSDQETIYECVSKNSTANE